MPGSPAIKTIMMKSGRNYFWLSSSSKGLPSQWATSLRLTPAGVAFGDHHVEDPLAALFFGFDQAQGAQVEQVALDEVNLRLRHAAPLNIERQAGEVRGSRFAFGRGRVAIVAAKFLLDLDGANSGVHLDLLVELTVVGLAQVLNEIARPRTAKAAIGIEARIDAQRLSGTDRDQSLAGLQRFQFVVVLNAGQIEAVDFFVLPQQRFVRRTEHRVPSNAANMMFAEFAGGGALRGVAVEGERLTGDNQGRYR